MFLLKHPKGLEEELEEKFAGKTFFMSIEIHGEKWAVDKTPEEQPHGKGHYLYLMKLYAEGYIMMAGPFWDNSAGVIVWNHEKVTSWEQAAELTEGDPMVKHGVADYVVRQWNIALEKKDKS